MFFILCLLYFFLFSHFDACLNITLLSLAVNAGYKRYDIERQSLPEVYVFESLAVSDFALLPKFVL